MFMRPQARLIIAAFALGLSGCGTNLNDVLLQSVSAVGRTFLDIALTDLANAVADSLDQQASAPSEQADETQTDEGEGDSDEGEPDADTDPGDDGDQGDADDTGGLTPQAASGEAYYAANGCATCHCDDASGGCALDAPVVGEDIDTLDEWLRGEVPHPGGKFDISDEQLADLQAYLASL
ncbi:MAG: cytochrome c [Planctomycetes bacterium]|nr:cytochrome c [Planctomycetota bacterium]